MPHADIVVGLGWGDEGKGATVDALAAHRRPGRVVRFNGGHQAGHNVVTGSTHHTFSTFGSATLQHVPTWISGHCTVEPLAALAEASALTRLGVRPVAHVDESCLVTTPLHAAANRRREAARGAGRHGSTGVGFGETVAYGLDHPAAAPRAADLLDALRLTAKLHTLKAHYVTAGLLSDEDVPSHRLAELTLAMTDAADNVFTLINQDRLLTEISTGYTIFEGAQGLWLDENFGAQPHTTWSTTTPANARHLLRAAHVDDVLTIGCVRTYATRHGAGPLPGEGELEITPAEPHNSAASFAGAFRTGAHDPGLLTAAVKITAVDALAVSHRDVLDHLATTEGAMAPGDLGPVLVTGYGPDRAVRLVTPLDR